MITLGRTRAAIGRAEISTVREDLLVFAGGAETALNNDLSRLAVAALRSIGALAVGLRKTLGPAIAEAILDGLWEDCFDHAPAMLAELGYRKSRDARCDIRPGKPVGSSSCEPADNSTCYTLADGSGCLSSRGATFVWEAVAA
jgi:hypothetical protein